MINKKGMCGGYQIISHFAFRILRNMIDCLFSKKHRWNFIDYHTPMCILVHQRRQVRVTSHLSGRRLHSGAYLQEMSLIFGRYLHAFDLALALAVFRGPLCACYESYLGPRLVAFVAGIQLGNGLINQFNLHCSVLIDLILVMKNRLDVIVEPVHFHLQSFDLYLLVR